MKRAALGLAVVGVLVGCAKRERAPQEQEKGPPPMAEKEISRGHDACGDFKEKVCACAAANPDNAGLADDCKLADSRISALALSVEVSQTENSSASDRAAAIGNARQTIKRCIERTSELAVQCSQR